MRFEPGYYHRNGYWVRTSKGQKWVKGSWYKKNLAIMVIIMASLRLRKKANTKASINSFKL